MTVHNEARAGLPVTESSCELSLVSIIVPCYNHAEWLPTALNSCLAQTYPKIEIIVVDDGSTDASANIAREFVARWPERIRFAFQNNQGVGAARNTGFGMCHGEYVQYLDADDYLRSEKIDDQAQCLNVTGADIVFGPWQYHRHPPDGPDFLAERDTREIPDDLILAMLNGWWIPPAAVIQRRTLVQSLGGFDEALRQGQDTLFYFRAAINRVRFAYSPHCHTVYRRQGARATWTGNRNSAEVKIAVNRACESALRSAGRLEPTYTRALANGYCTLAADVHDRDFEESQRLLAHAHELFRSVWPGGRERQRTARRAIDDAIKGWRRISQK